MESQDTDLSFQNEKLRHNILFKVTRVTTTKLKNNTLPKTRKNWEEENNINELNSYLS